ncbi:hypothetical protein [Streptococcus mutans]|nr:hypothetical protein [Streptococcus mutans]EMB84565.1 hypothetical protein SMU56_09598 [Streptococcus mutans N29]EMB83598.1 hypothetical protein SMU54_08641 [Streptococcus mutans A9]EMC47220.1 hypothetical protein SMU102_09793 [Streptococcus mutans S1B]MCB4929559.1 hypothetical protein [Streptococcus mutans]MCB5007191.1 hypothetical protein [Streptococcus mutans]
MGKTEGRTMLRLKMPDDWEQKIQMRFLGAFLKIIPKSLEVEGKNR